MKRTFVKVLAFMLALAMTANGADGETLAQMESVLPQYPHAGNMLRHFHLEYVPSFILSICSILLLEGASFLRAKREFYKMCVPLCMPVQEPRRS